MKRWRLRQNRRRLKIRSVTFVASALGIGTRSGKVSGLFGADITSLLLLYRSQVRCVVKMNRVQCGHKLGPGFINLNVIAEITYVGVFLFNCDVDQ